MKRILIVDDEPEIARSLQRVLRMTYEIQLANGPQDALAKLEAFAPDAVISDFRMPEMNGAQLLAEVHRRRPNTVGLILSGYSDLEFGLETSEAIAMFLKKPWNNQELLRELAALLEESEGASANSGIQEAHSAA
jgi:DNA-binding NtrC family response regulator